MQNFQKNCDVYGSFNTWILLLKAQNWDQNTFFWKFYLFMAPCYHILWLLGLLVPRTYSRTIWCAILTTLFALNSHFKSSFYTILLKMWPVSLFFCPFSYILSLSLPCLEYALIPCQLSSHITQFQWGESPT